MMIDKSKFTPEQLENLEAIEKAAEAISNALDDMPVFAGLGGLMNVAGLMIQRLEAAGNQQDTLMRTAVGLNELANLAARASGAFPTPAAGSAPGAEVPPQRRH